MNDLFAADPKIFNSANELIFFLGLFGFEHGRFLSEYPRAWSKAVYDQTEGLPEVEKMRIRRVLQGNKCAMLRVGCDYDSKRSWHDNALKVLEGNALNSIVVLESEEVMPRVLTIDDVADGKLPDCRGARVLATAENLVGCAELILKSSQEVYIVDPYISLGRDGYVKFFQQLFMNKYSTGRRFFVFCKDDHFKTAASFDVVFDGKIASYLAEHSSVRFFTLSNDFEMHGRYLFSIKGAIKYDKGFQVDPKAIVDVEFAGRALHDYYFSNYHEGRDKLPIVNEFSRS